MNFLKAYITFAASTGIKLAVNLVSVKIISLVIGAGGLGQLGQFMSVMNMVTVLAGGGIFTGVMKYVAEHRGTPEELKRYLSTSSMIALTASILVAIVLYICANLISKLLLGTPEYAGVVYTLAAVQFFIGANNYALAIVNGYEDIIGYAVITILGSITGTIILYALTVYFKLKGAMYGLILMPATLAAFSIPYILFRKHVAIYQIVPKYNHKIALQLLNYTAMLCVTVCTMPLAQIVLRKLIENYADWTAVGYWQGIIKLSDAYLMFIHVVLGNYYLPKLASKHTTYDMNLEVLRAAKIIVPVTALMSCSVYFARDIIIELLFSDAFVPMRDYFAFQMIGDFLKICAYTLGYVAVAKAMTRIYIIAELVQSIVFVFIALFFLKVAGPIGITYAYAINYLIYLLLSVFVYLRYIAAANSNSNARATA